MVRYWKRAAALLCAAVAVVACAGPDRLAVDSASPIEAQLLAEVALERGDYLTAVDQYLSVAEQFRDLDYARRATVLAWEYGFDGRALQAVERWLELEPDSEAAHGYRLRLATRFGQLDKALASIDVALGPATERQEQAYVALAGDLLSAPRNSLQLFKRLDTAFPDSPGIKRSLAEFAAQTDDIDAAIAYARQTLALRSDWHTTRAWLARLLLADGQRSSAFEQMAFALEATPGVEMELEFVQLMVSAGELEGAAGRLERISERFPEETAVVLIGAGVLAESGRTEEAAGLYQTLIDNGTCFSECYWQLALLAYARGDNFAALELFDQVGAGGRQLATVLAQSQIWRDLGEIETALAVLDEFARDYPKRRFAVLEPRAGLLTAAGRHAEAAATTTLALEYRPWSDTVWLSHGAALEQSGDLDGALAAFRRAWELAPDSSTAQNAYGYTLVVLDTDIEQARQLIASALAQEPDNPAIMDSMGWVLYKQGEVAAARTWLEQAYALLPDPEIAAHLVELLWSVGEQDAARALLTQAGEQFPDSRALANVRRLLEQVAE